MGRVSAAGSRCPGRGAAKPWEEEAAQEGEKGAGFWGAAPLFLYLAVPFHLTAGYLPAELLPYAWLYAAQILPPTPAAASSLPTSKQTEPRQLPLWLQDCGSQLPC